jgi:hypothetical protein
MQVEQIIKILEMANNSASTPAAVDVGGYEVGKNYLIRTVTFIYTGHLVAVYHDTLKLTQAAWIADTGRYADAVEHGSFDEVEPIKVPYVLIGRGAIVDAQPIPFALPDSQK